jgi:hypothetical protein
MRCYTRCIELAPKFAASPQEEIIMKHLLSVGAVLLSVAIVTMLSATSFAQNRERFGISAKAGAVNAVVGHVMVSRKDQQPQLLTNSDDLVADDVVTTGPLANVEVLLNPGSYFRLGEDSEFQFSDTALDNLRLKLVRGTAIVEVTGGENVNLQIAIETPQANFTILRGGLYRISVQSDSAELAVRKGRASFGSIREALVKSGRKVTFANGVAAVAKIEKDKDGLDLWSKQRAELLARANDKLSNRVLNGYLSTFRSWDAGFWDTPRWGLWTFSSKMRCYTFLPFSFGWWSPYGHYYGSYFDAYYWSGSGWGNRTIAGGRGPVNNNPSSNSGSNNTGGGSPAPSFVPPVFVPPAASAPTRVDPDTGARSVNKSREP